EPAEYRVQPDTEKQPHAIGGCRPHYVRGRMQHAEEQRVERALVTLHAEPDEHAGQQAMVRPVPPIAADPQQHPDTQGLRDLLRPGPTKGRREEGQDKLLRNLAGRIRRGEYREHAASARSPPQSHSHQAARRTPVAAQVAKPPPGHGNQSNGDAKGNQQWQPGDRRSRKHQREDGQYCAEHRQQGEADIGPTTPNTGPRGNLRRNSQRGARLGDRRWPGAPLRRRVGRVTAPLGLLFRQHHRPPSRCCGETSVTASGRSSAVFSSSLTIAFVLSTPRAVTCRLTSVPSPSPPSSSRKNPTVRLRSASENGSTSSPSSLAAATS